MGILKIARMGHPVLSGSSKKVEDPTAPEIKKLVSDMVETMEDAPGIGLAAPQVHQPLRIVIFKVPELRVLEKKQALPLTVLINPVIEVLTEDTEKGIEGCLSLPGMSGVVPRFSHIGYHGFDTNGKKIEREARDFHARVVQHECDHLDGVLYPMRMTDLSSFGFVEEMEKQNQNRTMKE